MQACQLAAMGMAYLVDMHCMHVIDLPVPATN